MRLYQLDVLIAEKALAEDKKQHQVVKELADYLKIGKAALSIIRNKQATDHAQVTPRIFKIADFFGCSVDELINPLAKKMLRKEGAK